MKLKRVLKRTPGLVCEVSQTKGILIHGDENTKRIMLAKNYSRQEDYVRILGNHDFAVMPELILVTHQILRNLFVQRQTMITGAAFHNLVNYIAISIMRSKAGWLLESTCAELPEDSIAGQIVREVHHAQNYMFSPSEAIAIQNYIDSLDGLDGLKKGGKSKNEYQDVVRSFIKEVEREIGMSLTYDEVFLDLLGSYIGQMNRRIRHGRNNINHYTNDILRRYPLAFHLVKLFFPQLLSLEIPTAELGFLALYLAECIDQNRVKIRCLLVSDCDTSFLYTIKQKLMNHFHCLIEEIDTIPLYLYETWSEDELYFYDLIFSTEHEVLVSHSNSIQISQFVENHHLTAIGSRIFAYIEKQQQQSQEELLSKYLTSSSVDRRAGMELSELPFGSHITYHTLLDDILFVIDTGQQGENEVKIIYLDKYMEFHSKRITQVIYVRYSEHSETAIVFFKMVSYILSFKFLQELKNRKM